MKTMQNRDQNQINPEHAGRKRICVLLGVLLLLLGLSFLPGGPLTATANAETVTYIDAAGEEQTATDVTMLTAEMTEWSGWYAVTGRVEIRQRVTVNGTAHLILCDGAFLKNWNGITVNEGNSFQIYGQNNGNGKLSAYGTKYLSGIGGTNGNPGGEIIINGGNITSNGVECGAGIGGGNNGAGGTIMINGGNITATGGKYGAGIGGGEHGAGGTITINGGNITSIGGECGTGIGGGANGAGGTITIKNGLITAKGGAKGAGIGGGNNRTGGTITINGGDITATGGKYGAGIGGGDNGAGGTITINGENVTATGGDLGAGIGGGQNGDGGSVTIKGGKITVTGGKRGAGIGGGENASGGKIEIYNGDITANATGAAIGGGFNGGSGTIIIHDGKITATGVPGIGVGMDATDASGKIEINGGTIIANGSRSAGIGSGQKATGATIVINGGNITADGGQIGAGIGGGNEGDGGTTTITGGIITATSKQGAGIGGGANGAGGNITITGGKITATSIRGAAIGGGLYGAGGDITIEGGIITATTTYTKTEAIGHGYEASDSGKLKLGDVTVQAGKDKASAALVSQDHQIAACRSSYVRIENCINHDFRYGICKICGKQIETISIPYKDSDGSEKTCNSWTAVTSDKPEWTDGWYAVIWDVHATERFNVNGTVNLILADNTTLSADQGIHVPEGSNLTIWQQNGTNCKLLVKEPKHMLAGIGGNSKESSGNVIINGGIITSHGGQNAAAIGGGNNGSNGSVIINAGIVIADNGDGAAGLGGGRSGSGGTITINGGTITAKGSFGAGIGGGSSHGSGGNITINGGTVTATAGSGAGIGSGKYGSGGNITINGGTVTATAGCGAGIGGGISGSSNSIIINGGTVTASASYGAGIGGGQEGASNTIKILGGQVTASSKYSSSIGPGMGFDADINPDPTLEGAPGPVILSWSRPMDYIRADSIKASSYTLEKQFLYSRDGEIIGEATAENLPDKESGDLLVPMPKDDAGVSITDGDLNIAVGEEITLQTNVTVAGENGQWTWSSDTTAAATVDENGKITAIAEGAAKITAIYESDTTRGETAITVTVIKAHSVHINATEHGTIQADPETALPGATITLTLTPETGYRFGTLLVTGGSEDVPVARKTEGDDSEWTFIMPDTDAYVSASFSEPNTYTASFFNFNGEYVENLQQSAYTEGTTPQYNGEEPERQATEQYTYKFREWNPTPEPIEQDTNYIATYTETLRNYPVTFQNWDETVLQTGDVAYGATPAYTGQTPVRPDDEQWVYRFSGWTPKIVPVTGAAVYTAEYERTQRLKIGSNTVPLQEYETVSCSFTPEEDSYYRFTSGVCEAHPIIRIYEKDGEEPIARDVDWRGGEHTFDCLAELTGGQEYTIEIMSLYGGAALTVNVAPAEVYGITVDPNIENGEIFDCLAEAYVGRQVVVGTEAAEGYMLEGLVVTDAEGHEIDTERDMFTMPASPVTVSARFAPAIPVVLDLEEPISVSGYGIGVEGLMTFPEGDDSGILYVWALEGFEIEMAFESGQDGVEIGSVTVTGADGTDVYCSVWQEDDSSMPVYRFIMPEEPVIVQVRAAQEYPEFGTANFILPEDTEIVEESAFEGDLAITSAEIQYGCERIGNYAFRNCRNLNKIRIPDFCEIGTDAFDGCTLVYIYGEAGSPADLYCRLHDNCVFVEE